jgi:DNA-binding NtrC family response regulator
MSKYKVLIVDDDMYVRNIVKEMLSLMDHSCHLASDGAEALSKTGEEHYDAVITDVQMPRMDGITLTRELHKRNPSLPVMVMTGFTDMEIDNDQISNSKGIIISKPFTAAEFFSSFNAMMRGSSSSSDSATIYI